MPVATPDQYNAMLDAAKAGSYAYPAINITSSESLNAALRGFAEAGSDGIIQISHGGGSFASGTYVNSMPLGAHAIAEMAHLLAKEYPVLSRSTQITARQTRLTRSSGPSLKSAATGERQARDRSIRATCSTDRQ